MAQLSKILRALPFLAATLSLLCLLACGLPGPPLPPSLELPQVVQNLTAERAGNTVTLTWTNPTGNTDKTAVHKPFRAEFCRVLGDNGPCEPVGEAPGTGGTVQNWTRNLPPAESNGPMQISGYRIQLVNHAGKSAGWSGTALVATGSAPGAVTALHAEYTARGVKLSWQDAQPAPTLYRIRRHAENATQAAAPDRTLESAGPAADTLDTTAARNLTYQYTVQPVLRQRIESATTGPHYLEIAGNISAAAVVRTADTFPPAVPAGLAAIAGVDNGTPYIDLAWEPVADADLAGYAVETTDLDATGTPPVRAAGIVGAAFRVQPVIPEHRYRFVVYAVDTSGNRSAVSAPAEATAAPAHAP